MSRSETVNLGVILLKEKMDHPWQDYRWRLAGLLPATEIKHGEPNMGDTWREITKGADGVRYHAGTSPLDLFPKETSAYKANLENKVPVIYAVLRESEDSDKEARQVYVHLITASPFEAQDYLDSGEEIVDTVPMPGHIHAWIETYVEKHHREEKFVKRKRDDVDLKEHKFGQEPIFATRKRMNGSVTGGDK